MKTKVGMAAVLALVLALVFPLVVLAGNRTISPVGTQVIQLGEDKMPQPVGESSTFYGEFVVVGQSLDFDLRIFTRDTQGNDRVCYSFGVGAQTYLNACGTAWGWDNQLKDTGWTSYSYELLGQEGRKFWFKVLVTGTDQRGYPTWAQIRINFDQHQWSNVTVSGPEVAGANKIVRSDLVVQVVDTDGRPINGATVWWGYFDGRGDFQDLPNPKYSMTEVGADGVSGVAHASVWDVPGTQWAVWVHYFPIDGKCVAAKAAVSGLTKVVLK